MPKVTTGKVTKGATYYHVASIPDTAVEMYEMAIKSCRPERPPCNVLKIHHGKPVVSLLYYPQFDHVAHPELDCSTVVYLDTGKHKRINRCGPTAPILHRKELMVTPDYIGYAMFKRLTDLEDQEMLLLKPPGIKRDWEAFLEQRGYTIIGHDLFKRVTYEG